MRSTRCAASTIAPGMLTTVYLHDGEGALSGSAAIVTLLRAEPATPLEEVAEHEPESVPTDADLPEVARTMTDYNLAIAPRRRRAASGWWGSSRWTTCWSRRCPSAGGGASGS